MVTMSPRPIPSQGVGEHKRQARLCLGQARAGLVGHKDWIHQTDPKEVLKRAHGFWKKIRPKVKNRLTEGKQRVAVEGISRFSAAEGAVRLPRE
eukprot:3189241-Pleurochrysis_carterae.AAC.1